MSSLGKFSSSVAKLCKVLRKLTLSKCKWIWNNTYQNVYYRAKNIFKKNMEMEFQIRRSSYTINRCVRCWALCNFSASEGQDMVFKEWSAQQCNTVANSIHLQKVKKVQKHKRVTIEREALGMLHRLEKFHHTGCKEYYCKSIITTYEYYTIIHHRFVIQTDPWSKKDEEMPDMCITINAIVMHGYTTLNDRWRNTNSNTGWWTLRHAVRTHTMWQVIDKELRYQRKYSHDGHL